MRLVRILNTQKYSKHAGRFQSNVFAPFGNGISVFDSDCAGQVSNKSLCRHIGVYYGSAGISGGEPFVFWVFDFDELASQFPGASLEPSRSDTGDDCHYDIVGVSRNQAKKFFQRFCKPPALFVCEGIHAKGLTTEEYENLGQLIEL